MFLPFSIYEAGSFDFSRLTLEEWIPIIYYCIVVTVVAFILWFQGVSRVPSSTAAVFTGIMPVSAVLLSYLILKESFLWSHLIGVLCVLLGIGLIGRGRRKQEKGDLPLAIVLNDVFTIRLSHSSASYK